jgi:hypothetical protein
MLIKIAHEGFQDEIEKIAEKEKKKPGWWKKAVGTIRAGSVHPTKIPIPLAHPELIGKRLLGLGAGGGIGAAGGAGVGAAVSALSKGKINMHTSRGTGALIGGITGGTAGEYQGEKHFFKKRGVTINPLWPLISAKFSPEAEKKYITKFQKKD